MGTMRLDRMLARCGYGTRKDVKRILKDGVVRINGQVVKDAAVHVDPAQQKVEVEDKIVQYREYIYLMLNKPEGVISATNDSRFPTVTELVHEKYGHFDLFPAGRLDRDSQGLILLTNDGQLSHQLTSPGKHVPKRYQVTLDAEPRPELVQCFQDGVILEDGYKCLPAQIELDGRDPKIVFVTLHEGKFHQIKRMFAVNGYHVTTLRRLSIGSLELDPGLPEGGYRELSPEEEQQLKN
ncbi:MAG TPA: 16S rRNA pseudouridine(516) synthase [Clostridiales bacterium]|nr:16S rRNA pseudouridine(516) synthase [Clostridiales bacterium]